MAGEVTGNLGSGTVKDTHIASGANITPTKIATQSLQQNPIPLTSLREWDNLQTLLPSAGTGTYLGLVTGTYGTDSPQAQTGDLHAAGATTRRARALVSLPNNYPASGNVSIRANAGMTGHVADTSATVLIEAYQLNDDGTLSANLVTTGALSCNSLTLAALDFTLTPTNLTPGARLDVRVSFAIDDAAGVAVVAGVLESLVLRCDRNP